MTTFTGSKLLVPHDLTTAFSPAEDYSNRQRSFIPPPVQYGAADTAIIPGANHDIARFRPRARPADDGHEGANANGKQGNIIYHDPVMVAVMQRAHRVAHSDASILVRGESGTGKELIARYIHWNSPRTNGPFVAVNCAAIPEQLLESELFGHERGAFTGAIGQRIGKLEAAQNGTILLDEISEMDRRLQAKLLRALQEREIDRIGGRAPVRLNVRIIATTNRDLEQEVVRQTFRQDLYFRLNVIAVHVPSLRDRPRDIPALAEHFIEKYCFGYGQSKRRLSSDALGALMAHDWPGNVRELENTIQRALVLTPDNLINSRTLEVGASSKAPCRIGTRADVSQFVGRKLSRIEREAVINTLQATNGNRTKAATILGLSIRALRNKINLYVAQGHIIPQSKNSEGA